MTGVVLAAEISAKFTATNNGPATGSEPLATPATTNSITATPHNGASPYTYAWTRVSGTVFTVNSPTSASTTFTDAGADSSAVYRCTVTDNASRTATTDVSVDTTHF